MKIMKDTTAMAYALREFMAGNISRDQLKHVDSALFAGEPYSAMTTCFAIAFELRLPIPVEVRNEYLNGVKWNEQERSEVEEYLRAIPLDPAA